MSPHLYDELLSNEFSTFFRLLELLEPEDGVPRCTVFQSTLEQCPPFAALSYVWGSPLNTRPIYMNSEEVLVRDNLWEFLAEASRRCPWEVEDEVSGETKYLWVDALCIDQENALEKNHQVKMMGSIYLKVSLAFLWLVLLFENC